MSSSKICSIRTTALPRRRPRRTAASTRKQQGDGVKIGAIDTNFAQGGLRHHRRQHEPRHQRQRLLRPQQHQRTAERPTYTRDGDFSLNESGLSLRSRRAVWPCWAIPSSRTARSRSRPAATDPDPVRPQVDGGRHRLRRARRRPAGRSGLRRLARRQPRPDRLHHGRFERRRHGQRRRRSRRRSTTRWAAPARSPDRVSSPIGTTRRRTRRVARRADALITNANGVAVTAATEWQYTVVSTDGSLGTGAVDRRSDRVTSSSTKTGSSSIPRASADRG